MKRFTGLIIIAALLVAGNVFAQDDADDTHDVSFTIPEVALLDIESAGSKDIAFTVTAPTEAGEPATIGSPTNNSLWLNITSIIAAAPDDSRSISAQITTGSMPGGLDLQVQAADDAGNGDGDAGSAGAAATLDGGASHDLVTGIGSIYTADGASNGYQLTYTLSFESDAFEDLDNSESGGSVTVTYTLSDN